MANSRNRINVISLSFDDCVYHPNYDFKYETSDDGQVQNPFDAKPNDDLDRLTETNQRLIDHLASQIKQGRNKEVTWMLGCGRQDFALDKEKIEKTKRGSCFVDLPEIMSAVKKKLSELNAPVDPMLQDEIETKFLLDKYLLADSYGIQINFDMADVSIQDAAACYEEEAGYANDAARQALANAKKADQDANDANAQIREYLDEVRQRRFGTALDNINAEERRKQICQLKDNVPLLRNQAKTQRELAPALFAKAKNFQAEAKALRPRPYGYGLNADDVMLLEQRKEMNDLFKSAMTADRDAQFAFNNENLAAAKRLNEVKVDFEAEIAAKRTKPIVYTRSMVVGDSWEAILVERQIQQLRQYAVPHVTQANKYFASAEKHTTFARRAFAEALEAETKALSAITNGQVNVANALYEKQDHANELGEEEKKKALNYYHRGSEQKRRAQEYLDVANILSLGPYVKNVAAEYANGNGVNHRTPSEAIMAAGYNPHQEYSHTFNHPTSFADDSKLTLLYAQMHKAASENPEKDIIFDFYDGNSEILLGLANFFKKNRDLLPGNLQLRLHHYRGNEPTLRKQINGNGPIDYNFHDNIRVMVESAGFAFINGYRGNAPIAPSVDCPDVGVLVGFWVQSRLAAFKRQRQFISDAIMHREKPYLPGTFNPKVYLRDLYADIEQFPENELHMPLKFALGALYEELEKAYIDQARRGVTPYKIEHSATKEMTEIMRTYLREFKHAAPHDRVEVTLRFVKKYQTMTLLRNFGKIMAVILSVIMGMVVGAALGISIGFAAGLITGPGAVVTGLVGMAAGISAGAIAGVAAGSVLVGVGGGLAAKFHFFGVRPDGKTKAMNEVMSAARAYAKNAAASLARGEPAPVLIMTPTR